MFCRKCGASINIDSRFCTSCGSSAQDHPSSGTDTAVAPYSLPLTQQGPRCRYCGSPFIVSYPIQDLEVKNRGCFGWLLWIFLALITFGLILIIPLVTNTKVKSKSRIETCCQSCGARW